MSKFTITTSISYPNGRPHLGHALEAVQADFMARYHKLRGDSVYFQTGVDVHGLKNEKAAAAAGMATADFVAGQTEHFLKLLEGLHVQYDRFISTGEDEHKAMAQALWRACAARGDIYKKTYRAWYNIKQEEFLGSADDIKDPSVFGLDASQVELIEEENYFFAQSNYTEQVLALLKSGEYAVYPAHRAQELIKFLEDKGLQDVSISRDTKRLSWGVPVPDDNSQVMYVWFDALTNYLTGCASLENGVITPNKRWPVDLHCVGKDISRFHGLMWPAMLLSAGLATPKALLIHGFILKEGHVMSKTYGNVIDPQEPLEAYGSDPLRWFLLRGLATTEDGEFTMERLAQVYASDLANDYGNLVSRVVSMAHKYCEGHVPSLEDGAANLEKAITDENWNDYDKALETVQINTALGEAQQLIVFCNRRIDELKPWTMAKDESRTAELNEFLYELLEMIRHITLMIWPAIPETCTRVATQIFTSIPEKDWLTCDRTWGVLEPGSELGQSQILFPRHD